MSIDSLNTFFNKYLVSNNTIGILILCALCFIIAGVFRMIFGKKGTAVKAVSAVLDLIILYSVVFTLFLQVPSFNKYQTELPFLFFFDDHISLISLVNVDRLSISVNLIHLIILFFLFGLTEDLLPEGKRLIPWLLLRVFSIIVVYILYSLLYWTFNTFLPGFLLSYAPMILLSLLAIFLAVTIFKWLLGLLLGITGGPIIGAIYTFFISNIIGKQLTKAALSCALFGGILYFLNYRDLTTLYFNSISTTILILSIAIPVAVRYLISKLF